MRVVELQNAVLAELAKALGERGFRYVKREQHFKKKGEGATFYFHIAFIQHASDVDATADVAVTYHLPGREADLVSPIAQYRAHSLQRLRAALKTA